MGVLPVSSSPSTADEQNVSMSKLWLISEFWVRYCQVLVKEEITFVRFQFRCVVPSIYIARNEILTFPSSTSSSALGTQSLKIPLRAVADFGVWAETISMAGSWLDASAASSEGEKK